MVPNQSSLTNKVSQLLRTGGAVYGEAPPLRENEGAPADFQDNSELARLAAKISVSPEFLKLRLHEDTVPIPHPVNREGYAPGKNLTYWFSGYEEFHNVSSICSEFGIAKGRLYDFGGSTGRVFRHFLQSGWDVWSSDFKPSSVDWNFKYYPSTVKVFLNAASPSLPLEDGAFDLVIGFSVFTHMNEGESGWLLELRRILRSGGLACLSIHDDVAWKERSVGMKELLDRHRPDIASLDEIPDGKSVVTFREDDPYNCHTFHSASWVLKNWGRFFKIVAIKPRFNGLQSLVVCMKP